MSTDEQQGQVILAAGGVVEKWSDHGPLVAVIHRLRYKGEWNLPKGKLKEAESLWEAAIREVKEETGCPAHISGFAGLTHYYHGNRPKFVLYWKMRLEGECNFQPSEEVDILEWLTPKEAQERLTYADERNLVSQTYDSNRSPRRNVMTGNLAAGWSRIWYQLFGSPRLNRLANALDEYEVRLKCRIQRVSPSHNACEQAVLECLARARLALQEFNFDSGWQNLHTAQSIEIWSYDDDEVLHARKVLSKEATKLSGWRKEAIAKLVGPEGDASQKDEKRMALYKEAIAKLVGPESDASQKDEKRMALYQATLVKNEDFNNLYYKIGVRGRNLKIAFFTLSVIVVGLPFMARAGLLWGALSGKMIVAIELTGIFGASFSVASSLTKSSVDEKIPQQILGSVVTWMRPVMGAAAAVAAYLLLQAGALPSIIKADADSTFVAFVIAFIAGFSERFIIGAVENILPEKK